MSTDFVSRRALRHLLMRRRNERIAELRDDRLPRAILLSHDTLAEVLIDNDPNEAHVIDFEGKQFLGIVLITDDRLEPGVFQVEWPIDPKPLPAPAETPLEQRTREDS